MVAMAEFELVTIGECAREGIVAARARGSNIGRKPSLTTQQRRKTRYETEMLHNPVSEVALHYGVHPRTLARVLQQDEDRSPVNT